MQFCMPHWDALREKIHEVGLGTLISESGVEVATKMSRELEEGATTVDNYDPLMAAHWAIADNAMRTLGPQYGLKLMMENEQPYACPICCLNEMYRAAWQQAQDDGVTVCPCGCGEATPDAPLTFDWMIERAASDQVEHWKEMQP